MVCTIASSAHEFPSRPYFFHAALPVKVVKKQVNIHMIQFGVGNKKLSPEPMKEPRFEPCSGEIKPARPKQPLLATRSQSKHKAIRLLGPSCMFCMNDSLVTREPTCPLPNSLRLYGTVLLTNGVSCRCLACYSSSSSVSSSSSTAC